MITDNTLEDCAMKAQSNILEAATKAALAVAQAILMNMPTGSHLAKSAQVPELESFDGRGGKSEQLV